MNESERMPVFLKRVAVFFAGIFLFGALSTFAVAGDFGASKSLPGNAQVLTDDDLSNIRGGFLIPFHFNIIPPAVRSVVPELSEIVVLCANQCIPQSSGTRIPEFIRHRTRSN